MADDTLPPYEARPVLDPKTGDVQLYDIYYGGEWIGSRRTLAYVTEAVKNEDRRRFGRIRD